MWTGWTFDVIARLDLFDVRDLTASWQGTAAGSRRPLSKEALAEFGGATGRR